MEILLSKRFESHSQSANGLKRPFGVKNDKYGPCHGADFYKNDTLSRSRNPENDTLSSGTSPYRKIYEYPPPPGTTACEWAICLNSRSTFHRAIILIISIGFAVTQATKEPSLHVLQSLQRTVIKYAQTNLPECAKYDPTSENSPKFEYFTN